MKVNDPSSKKPVSTSIQHSVIAKETPTQKQTKALEESLKEDAVANSKLASMVSKAAEEIATEVSQVRKDKLEEVKAKIAQGTLPDNSAVAEKIARLLN